MDSISGQWDYIEPVLFGWAAGVVIASYVETFGTPTEKAVAHFHEWMTAAGGLYLRKHAPYIATVFTTHATVMGRCIAGNRLPLYNDLPKFNADELARQFNVTAKHSIEKMAAAVPRRIPDGERHHGQRMQIPAGARTGRRDAQRLRERLRMGRRGVLRQTRRSPPGDDLGGRGLPGRKIHGRTR